MNENDRSITTLAALSHGMLHTHELSIPIFITVWLELFSTNQAILGSLAMIGYGLFGLGGVPAGIASDKFNPKTLLVMDLCGMSLAFVLIGLAPNLWLIGLAFGLWGIAASVHHPSALTLISRAVTARGRAFAYHGMSGNFGIAVGPFVASLLLSFMNWRYVAFLLAVPPLLAAVYGSRLPVDGNALSGESSDEDRDLNINGVGDFLRRSKTLMWSIYGLLFLVVMLEGLYYRGILTFLPDFFAGLPQVPTFSFEGVDFETSRYLYSGMLMLGMAGQYLGGRLTERYPPRRALTVVFSLLTVLAGLFVFVESYSFTTIVILSGLIGTTLFCAQPLYQATIAENTEEGSRGLAYGYTFFGIFGVGALGAGLSGYVLSNYSAQVLFGVLATIVLLAALVLLGMDWFKRSRMSKVEGRKSGES